MKSTVLWTNSTPGTQAGGYEANLLDSIQNYDYLKITYGYATNQYTTDNNINTVIVSVTDFINKMASASTGFGGSLLVVHRSNGYFYSRGFAYRNSDTKVYFGNTIQFSVGSNGAVNNVYTVPLNIIGIKS